jgi:type IV pilus assembly protein PilC
MLASMIGVGEESGSLESVLDSTANIYDEAAENAVKKMVSLLEPLMIIFIACMVGLLVFSMVLPIFGIYSAIG